MNPKPCPFCRHERCAVFAGYNAGYNYRVCCLNRYCAASGPRRKTQRAAIAAWNKAERTKPRRDEDETK